MKILMLVFGAFLIAQGALASDLAIGSLAVQDAGRVKPFETFARESLQLLYGKSTYEKRPAAEIVFTWFLQPQVWQDKEMIEIRFVDLKRAMNFPVEKKHFSLVEISNNDRLALLLQELQAKRETKEKLNPYYQAIQRLESQLLTFREIASGRMVRFLPPPPGQGDSWVSLLDLPEPAQVYFQDITKNFVLTLGALAQSNNDEIAKAKADLKVSVDKFIDYARAQNPTAYPSEQRLSAEVHYNHFHPFQWSWIFYLLSALAGFVGWIFSKNWGYRASWFLAAVGVLLNIYGMGLRVYLAGRPPVSNMYETVIWVGFGTVIFAMIIEAIYKWRFILLAGSIVGFFCLALADMAPAVLDPSIQPLEPVLRSQFWLMVHVMTITVSYAAFFLAFALGDIGLIFFIRGESEDSERIKALVLAIYRALQIGVALLAPGIILGGVWADYSWGRFWGWDPKETWALIALLGYIAVLHGRLAGMLKEFGMLAASVLSFSLVIMAWYGVNFVLGAGLHSYGFGAGGVEYVSAFVGLHILLVVFAASVRSSRLKSK